MLDQAKNATEAELQSCREEVVKLKTQLDERDQAKDSMETELRSEISAAKEALEAEREAKQAALDEARRDADEIANQQAQQVAWAHSALPRRHHPLRTCGIACLFCLPAQVAGTHADMVAESSGSVVLRRISS